MEISPSFHLRPILSNFFFFFFFFVFFSFLWFKFSSSVCVSAWNSSCIFQKCVFQCTRFRCFIVISKKNVCIRNSTVFVVRRFFLLFFSFVSFLIVYLAHTHTHTHSFIRSFTLHSSFILFSSLKSAQTHEKLYSDVEIRRNHVVPFFLCIE